MILDKDYQNTVKSMWDDAASIYNIEDNPVPEKKVHHFDIASLAEGLHKTVSEAAHINKL